MTIIVELEDGFLKVTVADTGIGISQEDQTRLFKLFGFLASSEQLNANGIGLGLVISQNLVQQFGGRIWVESEVGVGSRFIFTMKLDQPQRDRQILEIAGPVTHECDKDELVFEWRPDESDDEE